MDLESRHIRFTNYEIAQLYLIPVRHSQGPP